MTTLYLYGPEQKLFQSLSGTLQEGWTVEPETQTYDDSPPRQMMRLSLVRLHDPLLLALREKAAACATMDDIAKLIAKTDLRDVNDEDVASLFFGLGPAVIGHMIVQELQHASTDDAIETVAAFSLIRHTILSSFHPVS